MFRHHRHDPPMPSPRPLTPGLLEAQRAHADARARLEETIHQGPEVRGVMSRVFAHGQKNHWGQVLDSIWSGGT
jgi:hypothetical protein